MWSWRSLFESSNLKNFFLGSAHQREVRETRALFERACAAWRHLPIAEEEARRRFVLDIVFDACNRPDRFPGVPLLRATADLVYELLVLDGLYEPPSVQSFDHLSFEEGVTLRSHLHGAIRFAGDWERLSGVWRDKITLLVRGVLEYLPLSAFSEDDENSDGDDPLRYLRVPLIDLCEKPAVAVERTIATMYDDDIVGARIYETIRDRLERNLCAASAIPFEDRFETSKVVTLPTKYRAKSNTEIVDVFLGGTPFGEFFDAPLPFQIPFPARFEHMHIVGGTGHGKTQLMQAMIYHDLLRAIDDGRSVVVIDSQGDLIRTLSRLALFSPSSRDALAGRLIVVDPNDVEFPVCLNLFDWNRERITEYGALEREKLLNSAVELYEYLFGALLGAELTQRQGVIFKYLARLMMEIPDATIQTLREIMENGQPFRPFMARLPGSARSFFETRFFDRTFNETKKQILTRLWGVLSNATLERMFTHPRNKLDLYDALNSGKIVLINTAKDLLKEEGCAILGRFFIALIVQAAMERSAIAAHERNPAFIYIDEAQDYFDDKIGHLLNQARKYRIGMVLAHQNLDQLAAGLRSSIFASTSIKFAGGVSAKDGRVLDDEMRCDAALLLGTRKRQHYTEFACYVRNFTPQAVKVTVPLGVVESQATLDREELESLVATNRLEYAAPAGEFVGATAISAPASMPAGPSAAPSPEAPATGEARAAMPPSQAEAVPERPVSKAQLPVPVQPKRMPVPDVPSMGRGGRRHKYLQHLIKSAAEERGYRSVIEETILDGAGRVDVALAKAQRRIACEISVTTGSEHELQNVEKCLAAGFDEVILVATDERQRKAMRTFIAANLDEIAASRVFFLLPEEFLARLDENEGAIEPTEETVRGYKVRVSRNRVDPEEARARRRSIVDVLARSAKKLE